MKYTVAELKLIKKMVDFSNTDDQLRLSESLHKNQLHFCNIIDQVKIDPRCVEAHLFCTLFCSLALERAELLTDECFPCFPEEKFHDTAYKILQKSPEIGKRAETYPDRIRRHVLNTLSFDREASGWLETMISAFLVIIEKSLRMKSVEDRGRVHTLDTNRKPFMKFLRINFTRTY